MRETLIVTGLLVLAVALRTARAAGVRKLGAFMFLAASFCLVYFLTGSILGGLGGAVLWLFLPWIELLTRIRRMRLPIHNRLSQQPIPNPSFFPNATEAAAELPKKVSPRHVAAVQPAGKCVWHHRCQST